jgi:acetoin utilization deacetylase AcuC-like enzyme
VKPLSKLHTEAIEKARTEQAKVKAAALAMIETPMDLIKAVLLKHEEAVIEVMRELHQKQQADTALLRQALEALELSPCSSKYEQDCHVCNTISALRTRLSTGDKLSPTANLTKTS